MYSSASSLCNHRSKIHKVNKYYHDNTSIIHDNTSIIPTEGNNNVVVSEIVTVKTYDCKHCNRHFNNYQNRWKHYKICKNKNIEIIENKNTQIIETQNNNSQIIHNNTNNGTINNTTNNITINNYGDENKAFVSEAFMLRIISNIIKNDDKITEVIPHLIRNIHFNPCHKNNNNIKINNIRSPTAKVYKDKKWIYVDKKKMLNETHDKSVKFTENWAEEHKEKVPENTKDKIKDYKQIHSKQYHNKKKILDEITKLAYIYYKNYMEGELELDD
jgi:hypothetical protein